MDGIDQNEVRDFYNELLEIWPVNNLWYVYIKKQIQKYLDDNRVSPSSYVLNAGSAGNTYGLPYRFHHVDIAEKRLVGLGNATVASIENLPFADNIFDGCICVGSVINYCSAMTAISELLRVIKPGGMLILEFESSNSYEYRYSDIYGKASSTVSVNYGQPNHQQWVYSFQYIKSICVACGTKAEAARYFHIISAYKLGSGLDENAAAEYARYDALVSKLPYIRQHASNIIFRCMKL